MKKSLYIIIPLLILGIMEGVALLVWKSSDNENPIQTNKKPTVVTPVTPAETPAKKTEEESGDETLQEEPMFTPATSNDTDFENFPAPTVEEKNGRMERTIHIGVRQFVWEPGTITAKKGELVRLIVHNADVMHGLVIPDLGVMEGDIPPEGAVIEFEASKVGTFEFFCSVWCGDGHMEMRGKIIIQ